MTQEARQFLKMGFEVGRDGIGRRACAQRVDPLAVPQEGGDPDTDGFDRAAEILDPGRVGLQPVGPGEDQQALGSDRHRRIDAMIFVAKRQHLRAELETDAGEISLGDLVFADDERLEVTRKIAAQARRPDQQVWSDEEYRVADPGWSG